MKARSTHIAIMAICALLVAAGALALVLQTGPPLIAQGIDDQPASGQEAAAPAAIPATFSYQGILRGVDGGLVTGNRDFTFVIYDSVTDGNALHTETINDVAVYDGVFNVVLGDAVPLGANVFADAPRFLGISVNADPEMIPRQRFHPVPWAQQASVALQANAANTASMANTATQANVANTLVNNATVHGLTVNNSFRLDGLFSMGANGAFHIDAVNWVGGRFIVTNDGNVGIGNAGPAYKLDVNGKIRAMAGFNGNCVQNAWNPGVVGNNLTVVCNQDIAESFAAAGRTEPGDLVALAPESLPEPTVRLSQQPYESLLFGVVSTNPGLLFDQGNTYLAGDNSDLITDERTVVAMVGRVLVKFSLENGPIAVGDPLTSSSTPGVAMRASQAGQIVGYALQDSDQAETDGRLLAWLQVGHYLPPHVLAALNQDMSQVQYGAALAALQAENAALEARLALLEQRSRAERFPWTWPLLGGLVLASLGLGARTRQRARG